jgi:hypothetical protein
VGKEVCWNEYQKLQQHDMFSFCPEKKKKKKKKMYQVTSFFPLLENDT